MKRAVAESKKLDKFKDIRRQNEQYLTMVVGRRGKNLG